MTNRTLQNTSLVNPTTLALASGAIAVVTFVTLCREIADGNSDDGNERVQLERHRHIVTSNWLTSEENENAVTFNTRDAAMSQYAVLNKLHELYPNESDIIGIRGIKTCLNVVFGNPTLMNKALLNGLRINNTTTLYPTKTLDADYNHSLLTIKNLPIFSMDVTKQKIERSLAALFESPIEIAIENAIENHLDDDQNSPPVIHDYFFHQKPVGHYSGTLTVILRGYLSTSFSGTLQLVGFDGEFECLVNHCLMYCRRCNKYGDHKVQNCPSP